MRKPLSLAGRTYLLAFDRDRDRLANRTWLGYALRGAALAELVAAGRVVDDNGRAVAVPGVRPPSDPVLRAVLADLGGRRWRALAGRNRRETERAVAAGLEADGYIRVLRPATRWRRSRIELRDPRALTRLTEQVSAIIRGPLPIARTPAVDVALIAILAAAGIKTGITKLQRGEYADRIAAAITAAGAPIDGMKHAISQARSSMS
jgi:hypothetical protein